MCPILTLYNIRPSFAYWELDLKQAEADPESYNMIITTQCQSHISTKPTEIAFLILMAKLVNWLSFSLHLVSSCVSPDEVTAIQNTSKEKF